MIKFMRKIPGGLLLIPMLISALFKTFAPNIFNIGGMTESFFTTKGVNYIVALVSFCSTATLDISKLKKVIKKQGSMLLFKALICFGLAYLYHSSFGEAGIIGISALAFTASICSINPSLYLVLTTDYGDEADPGAFTLCGLLCVPAFPILVYSVSKASVIDWMPVISTLVPMILGLILGNLDKEFAKFVSPAIVILTPFMGWSFGASVNLIDALKAGPTGIIISIVFYAVMLVPLYLFETKILKGNGISAVSMCSIAGLSVSVPTILLSAGIVGKEIAEMATAQIALGVVITSILTPIIAGKLAKMKNIPKNSISIG